MEIHPKLLSIKIFLIIIIPLFFAGCIANTLFVRQKKVRPEKKAVSAKSDSKLTSSKSATEAVSLSKKGKEETAKDQKVATLSKSDEEQKPVSPLKAEEEKKETATTAKKTPEVLLVPLSENENGQQITSAEETAKDQKVATLSKSDEEHKTPISLKAKKDKDLSASKVIKAGSPVPQAPKKTSQEILDSALEFCQASYDFWQQGDLPNAIDALDQAYSLILKIDPKDNPNILQQKEDLRYTISKRIMEVYSSRFTVVNGHNNVIPLVMNRHVVQALGMFSGRERKFFLAAYRRSGKYRPAIIKALKEAGLPEELSWLPLIESGFKLRAFSRSRALGLWQFIASTGYKFGLKRNHWIDERMDPEKSTTAAIAYLKELHQIFGDWTTALAAYNCGEGTVLKCIQTQRISYLDNFWDLYEKLPRETAFYVPRFLAVLHILNNPEAHGFILPDVEEEIQAEKVTIDKQVHLRTTAKHLEVPYSLLKDLNSELRYDYTPKSSYALKVPKGKGPILLAKLATIPAWHPPVSAYVTRRVVKGDTLSTIARRYRTSVRAIMNLNGLRSRHFIKAGWKLKIPTGIRYTSRRRIPSSVTHLKKTTEPTTYVVRKGDSLWKIANRFRTTTNAIQSENKLNDASLYRGQVLIIPQGQTVVKDMNTRRYTVLKGDSPYVIAQKHRMHLSEFLKINNLAPRTIIYPGQELLVKAN